MTNSDKHYGIINHLLCRVTHCHKLTCLGVSVLIVTLIRYKPWLFWFALTEVLLNHRTMSVNNSNKHYQTERKTRIIMNINATPKIASLMITTKSYMSSLHCDKEDRRKDGQGQTHLRDNSPPLQKCSQCQECPRPERGGESSGASWGLTGCQTGSRSSDICTPVSQWDTCQCHFHWIPCNQSLIKHVYT